ncbi:DeoR/GlpR transcriptional regulator [Paenibacillaceae bacterium]|nr:DeoR/GlpR transcriptional regulator [Paenibacillaceae bacterium]
MLAAQRHRNIIERLEQNGSVKVSELSDWFQVTEKTIREDLEKLEEKGLLRRIHGGAMLKPEGEDSILPLQLPNSKHGQEKAAIAEHAIKLIEPDDIIALDAGSTMLEIARRIKNIPLTVLTNDLLIIRELTLKDQIRLIVPGGSRHHNLLIGGAEQQWISRLNVHKLFLSTTGIHPEYGLTIFTEELAKLKKVFIACSKVVYCAADHSKFDKGALITFADLSEVDYFITDDGLEPAVARKYEEQAVKLLRAPLLQ